MQWDEARKFLNGIFSRDEAAFSRRDMLAGLGLAALFATAPKLLAPGVAEAKPDAPVPVRETVADATNNEAAEPGADERNAADSDTTELSAQRYYRWRRRYWRRRYWRRRYWRRRYWYRPYGYRRYYWRRRYWRRRYW
jgi:hypothetical protein